MSSYIIFSQFSISVTEDKTVYFDVKHKKNPRSLKIIVFELWIMTNNIFSPYER